MTQKTVGLVGLGLLGRGIAACLLGYGHRVIAYTRRHTTRDFARNYIARAIRELIDRAGFPASLARYWTERYQAADSCAALEPCEFVIESVVEDAEVKGRLFDQIEAAVEPDVPIASNTSALPISHLQRGRKHPQRFLGMHWCEPGHATRFMELIRGEQTSDAAFAKAVELARACGKEPSLVQKDVPAFIVNRLGYAMYREALHILQMGVGDVETIDRSFRNAVGLWSTFGGPFRWIDISGGPAVYARAMAPVLPTLSNAAELPAKLQELADADAQGIGNGHGFYEYTEEEAKDWDERFHEHAWTVRELMNRYYPLDEPAAPDDPPATT